MYLNHLKECTSGKQDITVIKKQASKQTDLKPIT